jgi:hypothetical protein
MMGAQPFDELAVVGLAVEAFRRKRNRVDAAFESGGEARRVGAIRNDDGDFGVEALLGNRVGDRQKIRASAGEQNSQALHFILVRMLTHGGSAAANRFPLALR